MTEADKYSEDSRFVVYKHSDNTNTVELNMMFDKQLKSVNITMMTWQSNGTKVPYGVTGVNRHASTYGHWVMVTPTLTVDDIEFMQKKCAELFRC